MQSIYNYTPDTNPVPTVRSAAAVLQLQSVLHVMLFPTLNVLYLYMSTVRSAQYGCFSEVS